MGKARDGIREGKCKKRDVVREDWAREGMGKTMDGVR